MPHYGSMGYSDNTPIKQEHFTTIMQTLCHASRGILRRHTTWTHPAYLYLDLYAGGGNYPGGTPEGGLFGYLGSPLIALEAARASRLPLHAVLCERDPATLATLQAQLNTAGLTRTPQAHDEPPIWCNNHPVPLLCYTLPGDVLTSLPPVLADIARHQLATGRTRFGVCYADPNGTAPFDLFRLIATTLPRVDLVVHLNSVVLKRLVGSRKHREDQYLPELLATIPKDYWIVREPYGVWQWTFLIGTNWDSFPSFERHGFWPVTHPRGAAILDTISYPREKRRL